MSRQIKKPIDRDERRENALRPCKYLGYNWDDLGLYFIDREAPHTAEAQFRRAIWLNPFEPEFKLHLAGCLFQQKRNTEARDLVVQAMQVLPEREDAKQLLRLIDARLADSTDPATRAVDQPSQGA